eukprot:g12894.t1
MQILLHPLHVCSRIVLRRLSFLISRSCCNLGEPGIAGFFTMFCFVIENAPKVRFNHAWQERFLAQGSHVTNRTFRPALLNGWSGGSGSCQVKVCVTCTKPQTSQVKAPENEDICKRHP